MKKLLFAAMVLFASVILAACEPAPQIPAATGISEENASNDAQKPAAEEESLPEESAAFASEESARRLAFGRILWDVYQTGTLPDGRTLEYVDMEAAEDNSFALADVDGDGQEELLLFLGERFHGRDDRSGFRL